MQKFIRLVTKTREGSLLIRKAGSLDFCSSAWTRHQRIYSGFCLRSNSIDHCYQTRKEINQLRSDNGSRWAVELQLGNIPRFSRGKSQWRIYSLHRTFLSSFFFIYFNLFKSNPNYLFICVHLFIIFDHSSYDCICIYDGVEQGTCFLDIVLARSDSVTDQDKWEERINSL